MHVALNNFKVLPLQTDPVSQTAKHSMRKDSERDAIQVQLGVPAKAAIVEMGNWVSRGSESFNASKDC